LAAALHLAMNQVESDTKVKLIQGRERAETCAQKSPVLCLIIEIS